MKIVVEDESPEKEDREFSNSLYHWLSGWVNRILFVILAGWGLMFTIHKLNPPEPVPPQPEWVGKDSSKRAYQIKHWDFENHVIEYYEPETPSEPYKVRERVTSSVEIPMGEGYSVVINGVSSEEVLESLEIDYEDVRDYLGAELR